MTPYIFDNNKGSDLYSRLLEDRIVYIGSDITSDLANSVIAQLLYLKSVSTEPITIYLNTPGGSISAGMAIYDAIQRTKKEIEVSTVCVGLAASMGAVLLCCGTKGKRFILPHSQVMIHQALGQAEGKCDDVLVAAELMQKTQQMLIAVLSANTGLSPTVLKQKMQTDTWLTADDAIKLGFCDSIIE